MHHRNFIRCPQPGQGLLNCDISAGGFLELELVSGRPIAVDSGECDTCWAMRAFQHGSADTAALKGSADSCTEIVLRDTTEEPGRDIEAPECPRSIERATTENIRALPVMVDDPVDEGFSDDEH